MKTSEPAAVVPASAYPDSAASKTSAPAEIVPAVATPSFRYVDERSVEESPVAVAVVAATAFSTAVKTSTPREIVTEVAVLDLVNVETSAPSARAAVAAVDDRE